MEANPVSFEAGDKDDAGHFPGCEDISSGIRCGAPATYRVTVTSGGFQLRSKAATHSYRCDAHTPAALRRAP